MWWIWLLLGLVVGGTLGFVAFALWLLREWDW
ncbi:hypothetical protein EDD28_0040 [Salana multivorans]|uniref:Uncharacterized protein n=1 Tax=Salana multivorans TaxID=120377 RepID=A0A3N2D6T0_9MICO|nr:hypothetical protein EDD28_0040 [Salana multivorans]